MDLNFITNHVLFEVREGVAYITLNDPEHLNPVTAEVTQDLVQCLIYCERENEVRAIVFRGAGGNFTAGGNVRAVSYTHLTLSTTPYV